jgi:uncharacterized protein (TIGR03067 family)
MHRILPLLALMSLAFAPAPFPKERSKSDLRKLQGEWVQVREENAHFGVTHPQRRLVIAGSKATLYPGGQLTIGAALSLDPGRSPRTLEFRFPGAPAGQRLMRKSYRLDGDVLELCYDPANWEKPPRKISGKEDGLIVETYRRKKRSATPSPVARPVNPAPPLPGPP